MTRLSEIDMQRTHFMNEFEKQMGFRLPSSLSETLWYCLDNTWRASELEANRLQRKRQQSEVVMAR